MCGVVAALGKGATRNVFESLKLLEHRGVRQSVLEGRTGTVGHVRLPIVGLGTEHDQPKRFGDQIIGFVGELLDFRDTDPEAESDVEVVRDIWARTGPTGFTIHDGFWGIVVVDDRLGLLHILTDYLGQKPMYYRVDGHHAAASEINALLPFGRVTLDHVYLSACVKWGYCPDLERTPYREIKHVLPGEYVVLGMGAPYRKVTDPLHGISDPHAIWEEIELAVKRRVLSSDVPVACLLSGGLDSAVVYTLAKRYGDVKVYTAVSKGDYEEDFWAAVRVMHGTVDAWLDKNPVPTIDQQPTMIKYDDVNAEQAMSIFQEPIDLGSLRPQIALAKSISESVCLTGDGADEVFGGYERSTRYDSQHSDVFQELPAWHLPRLDRAMMHNRVEVRSPFLARRVVQLGLGLHHELRMNKNWLRFMAGRILPPTVTDKPKKALRTTEISRDREAYSRMLVKSFVDKFPYARQEDWTPSSPQHIGSGSGIQIHLEGEPHDQGA